MRVKYMNRREAVRNHLDHFPNFHKSGSVIGMKKKYYGEDALLVRSGSYIYKVPREIYDQAH